jgi:hypothetical protein
MLRCRSGTLRAVQKKRHHPVFLRMFVMGPKTISEKDARRLRVLKVTSWIGCPVFAVLG